MNEEIKEMFDEYCKHGENPETIEQDFSKHIKFIIESGADIFVICTEALSASGRSMYKRLLPFLGFFPAFPRSRVFKSTANDR